MADHISMFLWRERGIETYFSTPSAVWSSGMGRMAWSVVFM